MRRLALVLCLNALAAAPASAQGVADAAQNVLAAQARAEAEAARPGDEALTCEQIELEIGASMNTSEMHANRDAITENAERQQQRSREAQARAQSNMAANMALGVAGAFIPGAGYAQQAAMMTQYEQQRRDGQAAHADMSAMMGNLGAMMPAMMRGQRLVQLARAQDCAFVRDMPMDEALEQ